MADTEITFVPAYEHNWSDDFSYLRTVTCTNHKDARYLTKNIHQRSLILTKLPTGNIPRTRTGECDCSQFDLVVILHNGSDDVTE